MNDLDTADFEELFEAEFYNNLKPVCLETSLKEAERNMQRIKFNLEKSFSGRFPDSS